MPGSTPVHLRDANNAPVTRENPIPVGDAPFAPVGAHGTSSALATGSTVTQIVIYKDTGTASTSRLIAREDTVSTPTNGGTMILQWDNGPLKIFKL